MDVMSLTLAGVRVVGSVLLNFIWQGAAIGLVYAAVRSVLPRGEPRYLFGMVTLVALASCPMLTGWWLLRAASPVDQVALDVTAAFVSGPAHGSANDTASSWLTWGGALDAVLPWVVLLWSLGVLLLSARAWRQWWTLKALVRRAGQAPVWQSTTNGMIACFGLRRRVTVLCSKAVAAPVLVGWIRPVILLPMAVACGFPRMQVELILAHELAHLRRWDPLANLFQVMLETLHFYHPVVHWISRDVRNEREICCDELALRVTGGSRHEFVTVLAELGELRERNGTLLLAANGGVLLDRVQHIVASRQDAARIRPAASLVAVLLGATLMALAWGVERKLVQPRELLAATMMPLSAAMAPLAVAFDRPVVADPEVSFISPHLARPQTLRVMPTPAVAVFDTIGPAHLLLQPIAEARKSVPLQTGSTMAVPAPVAVTGGSTEQPVAAPALVPANPSPVAPTPIHMRQPVYPLAALMRGLEGKVVLEFGLAADGSVRDLRVVGAEPAGVFDQAATRAMRGWTYAIPPVATLQRRYRQTMVFVLEAAAASKRGARAGIPAAGEVIHARGTCRIVTGTHICRWLDGGAAAVSPQT
jgi:bla regulator protein blaR1